MDEDGIELEAIFRTNDPDKYIETLKGALQDDLNSPSSYSKDPLDRALSLALDLALSEVVDPLDVDLSRFSSLYIEKVKNEKEVDFVTAGKIVLMAWSVLKLQSDLALRGANDVQTEDESESLDLDIGNWDWLADEKSFDFTRQVLSAQKPPISERLTRKSPRKVTLMELIEALRKSKRELSRRERRRAEREKQKLMRSNAARKDISKKVVDEILESIDKIWSVIRKRKKVKIDDLYEQRDELVMAFGSILQLASDGKVELEQKDFPFGDIWVWTKGAD